jgi:hypothetical protein
VAATEVVDRFVVEPLMEVPVDKVQESKFFKPSEVNLFWGFPPLVDTFGKTEIECAAFYIVRTLAVNGDAWRGVRWTEIADVIKDSMERVNLPLPPLEKASREDVFVKDLATNPFARPDFFKLVDKGFARWLGKEGEKNRPIEFTDHGFERLQRWIVRKAETTT